MSNRENDDERLAKKWLESQGYSNIERPEEDPPDYVVDDNLAVEVRRLNLKIQVNGRTEGEETSRISLSKTIESILSDIDLSGNEQSWIVNCEYDFSCSLPNKKVVEKQIHEALQPLTQPYDANVIHQLRTKCLDCDKHAGELDYLHNYDLHLCLPCGICLELGKISATPARFLLQDVSDGKGVIVLPELESNINAVINEKSQKIKGRKNEFDRWWLILIDYICYIPNSGLTQTELENLRTSIRVEKPWSRIVIVSLWSPNNWYELLSPSDNLEFNRISGEV